MTERCCSIIVAFTKKSYFHHFGVKCYAWCWVNIILPKSLFFPEKQNDVVLIKFQIFHVAFVWKRLFYCAFVWKCTDVCKHRFGVHLLQNPPLCSSTVATGDTHPEIGGPARLPAQAAVRWGHINWGNKYFVPGWPEHPRQDKKSLVPARGAKRTNQQGPLSFVLFESLFSSVSPVSRGRPSLVSLVSTLANPLSKGSLLPYTQDGWVGFFSTLFLINIWTVWNGYEA